MKKFCISVSLAASIMAGGVFPTVAATKSLPIVEILGTKYYLYETRKGDTLFGIARDQNWNDAELKRLNPQAVAPLRKGTKIYYPVNVRDTTRHSPAELEKSPVRELTHVVGKGESIYSIAGLYGVPVELIYKLNPSARDGVRTGDVLSLRPDRKDSTKAGEKSVNPAFHTVSKSETIKQIADDYDTSVASLMAMNPGMEPEKIDDGDVLKIPEKGAGLVSVTETVEIPKLDNFELYTVEGQDTWQSIADKKGVSAEVIEQANPDVSRLKNKQVIAVPNVVSVKQERTVTDRDSRESSEEGIRSIYDDVHKVSHSRNGEVTVKVAIVAESPSAKKDTEFIRGFLTGLDQLKNQDFKVSLKVIDANRASEQVIEELGEFVPNLVFFTGDKNMPSFLRDYALTSLTPVVNTFDIKNEDYLHNPYIIQLLSPSAYFNESVAGNAYSKFGDHRLVLIGQPDASDQLAPELVRLWNPGRITRLPDGMPEPGTLSDDDKYLFYAYTVKKNEVEKILKDIDTFNNSAPLADVIVLGRPNWIVYDESLADELHKVNTYIPSRFYMDANSEGVRNFNNAYKTLFNRTPAKSLPLYAAVGYDASTYFIKAMAESSNDVNLIAPSSGTLQSEFDLQRVSNWGGFINPPVYFVNFTPFDTVDKIVIR